jgi:hypothetical protein
MSTWLRLATLCAVLATTGVPAVSQEVERWDRYLDRPRGPYRGQVVDAETKAPLAGAVVVARWLRDRVYPLHSVQENYAARETLTDSDGRFVLDARDVEEGAPRRTYHPEFLIFTPGYGSFPHLYVSPRGFTGGLFEGSGAIVELPRLQGREERRKHLRMFGHRDFSNRPFKELPELVRKINAERIDIGLQPHESAE